MTTRMPIPARLVFRLSLTVTLALAAAYALQLSLPYLAPIFALVLSVKPQPAFNLKKLIGLIILLTITMGIGLLMIPALINYRYTALLFILFGLFFSNFIALNKGKGPVGSFLTMGLTLITAAGVMSFPMALEVVDALMLGIATAVVSQWIIFPLFPLDGLPPSPAPPPPDESSDVWGAARATLVTFPVYYLGLCNPSLYLPIIMKSVSIGQQKSVEGATKSIKEIMGSTLMGGLLAILLWLGLSMKPNLWMFALWTLLLFTFIASKIYQVYPSKYPASFWMATGITLLILIGPAVGDTATGKAVWMAFAVRVALFLAVSLYGWTAMQILEHLKTRRKKPAAETPSLKEACDVA